MEKIFITLGTSDPSKPYAKNCYSVLFKQVNIVPDLPFFVDKIFWSEEKMQFEFEAMGKLVSDDWKKTALLYKGYNSKWTGPTLGLISKHRLANDCEITFQGVSI